MKKVLFSAILATALVMASCSDDKESQDVQVQRTQTISGGTATSTVDSVTVDSAQ